MTTNATALLDHDAPAIRALVAAIPAGTDAARVREAHRRIAAAVRPVYTVDERQPASVTLAKGRGSCSQRIALLEAAARALGVPTRVRALQVSGRFWHPRFAPVVHPFLPRELLLAWPQFLLDGRWIDLDELFGDAAALAERATHGFTNTDETLFEAVAARPVDFLGKTCSSAACRGRFDLADYVLADLGFFEDRDRLFAERAPLLQDTWRGVAFEAVYGGRKSV